MEKKRNNVNMQGLPRLFNTQTPLTVGKKRVVLRPVRLAALLAAVLLLLAAVGLLSWGSRAPRPIDMDFETGGSYTAIPSGKDILLYNNRNIKAVSPRGETLWTVEAVLSQPLVETAGDYVLAADLGGNSFAALYKDGAMQQEFVLGKDIISGKVNKHGMVAFATAADGYKGQAVVLDRRGRELFRWNSGEGYIMDLAINASGRYLAVAQLLGEEEQAGSRIQFIDLQRGEVVGTADRPNAVIGELRFSGSRLLAVSDTQLCGFTGRGRELYTVSFAGKTPGRYDISSDRLLAFVTADNRGNAVLELYTPGGKCKGRYFADSAINSLAVSGDTVVIARQRELLCISSRGKLKKQVSCTHDIKCLGLCGDGRTALAIGSTQADIVRIR